MTTEIEIAKAATYMGAALGLIAVVFVGFAFVKRLKPWKHGIELWGITVVSLAAASAFVGQAVEYLGEHDPHQTAVLAPATLVSIGTVVAFLYWLIREQRLGKTKNHSSDKEQGDNGQGRDPALEGPRHVAGDDDRGGAQQSHDGQQEHD